MSEYGAHGLGDCVQVVGLFVVTFIAMAAHAAFLPEEIFSVVDDFKLHVAAGQHHVGSVAILATGLRIFLGEEWIGYPLRKDYEPYDVEV